MAANVGTSPVNPIGSGIPATDMWQVVLGLALVVGLIFVVAWAMRRLQSGAVMGNASMRVAAAMSVGPRERLLLIDIEGTQILLGITATQINTLHSFAEPVVPVSRQAAGEFTERLRQAIGFRKAP